MVHKSLVHSSPEKVLSCRQSWSLTRSWSCHRSCHRGRRGRSRLLHSYCTDQRRAPQTPCPDSDKSTSTTGELNSDLHVGISICGNCLWHKKKFVFFLHFLISQDVYYAYYLMFKVEYLGQRHADFYNLTISAFFYRNKHVSHVPFVSWLEW